MVGGIWSQCLHSEETEGGENVLSSLSTFYSVLELNPREGRHPRSTSVNLVSMIPLMFDSESHHITNHN